MKVVALVSGGKDSTYNVMQCVAAGHTIVALANLYPDNQGELDSYMYQSVAHEGVALLGKALGLPLYRQTTSGKAHHQDKDYIPTNNDEVEDLYDLLKTIQGEISFDAVAVGAILSDYQRIRVENICSRLGLISLAYLWRRNQTELLNEMVDCGVRAVIVKVAALGLEPNRHLGVPVGVLRPHLQRMNDKYGLHVCGEGGEYETFTLDCPLYANAIVVDHSETVIHSDDAIAAVGYLKFTKLHLNPKDVATDISQRLKGVPIKGPLAFITDIEDSTNIECVSRDDNEDKEETISSTTENYYDPPVQGEPCKLQHKMNYARSNGWLWIGGLAGHSEDAYEAMTVALTKLKSCLSEVGFSIRDVCAVTMYVNDMSKYAELNAAYCTAFKYPNPPARVCIQCPLSRTSPVLLDALAYSASTVQTPSNSATLNHSGHFDEEATESVIPDRITLHVQGISHWAPANIGPYSQAIQVGDIIRVAGQIGMVPGTLELIEGGVLKQCRISLRHVGRIVAAMDGNMQLRDVVQGVCYVTHPQHISIARKEWEKRTNNAIVDYLVISQLPKNALVEWHFWAHKHNSQFEYEETGQCVGEHLLSIRRRFNYENKVSAVVCYVEHRFDTCQELDPELHVACLDYALSKLNQDYASDHNPVCNLRFFYPVNRQINLAHLHSTLAEYNGKYNIVYTVIPVCQLQDPKTLLSVCGVRYE